jgi:hypothetical protein
LSLSERNIYNWFDMKLRQKIILGLAALLCALFLIGESGRGQVLLRGKQKTDETHSEADDRYMGAGLAPFVYCLIPGAVLFIYGIGDVLVCKLRNSRRA